MKKTKPYYLKKYKEWMAKDRLPSVSNFYNGGLCGSGLSEDVYFKLFEPTIEDRFEYHLNSFWGDGFSDGYLRPYNFTPLRQTIVLFLAAMNNEL